MTVRISVEGRNAGLDATFDRVDIGGAGVIRIYSGSQPATANTAPTGTLLATLPLNNPGFTPATGGSKAINLATTVQANAVANGTAGWARMSNGNDDPIFDGSVAVSGGDFTINTTALISAQAVVLLGGTITDPV